MNKRLIKLSLLLILCLSLVSLSLSQGRQTGSISGTVVDQEGTPLPGCTVTLSGPKMLGTKTYVTSDVGRFRFPALSPGRDYELRVEMPGFKTTIRKGLIVNVAKTTEVKIELEVTTIEEEITVVAASPVVDVETSKISVNYSADFIASIPLNRDLYDIQNSIPGAISEGRQYRRTSSILGGTVRSTLYQLDGVPMNDPATFYSMANINIDVYEEMEVGIGAHPAEFGQTDSAVINIVTKSGGNRFSGIVNAKYTHENLAENLISLEDIEALNVDEPEKFMKYADFSLNFGGPIIKDRIWFFLNGRRMTYDQRNPSVPENRLAKIAAANPGMFSAVELQHYDLGHEEWLGFAKLTFQISPSIKYMGMLHYNHIYEPIYSNRIGSSYSWSITGPWNHENTYTTTHQFNWIFNQNTFLDLRGTYIHRYFPINSRPETSGQYTYYDRKERVYWGQPWYNDEYVRKKILASTSITRFQDDLLGGSHELKAGVEFEQTEYHRDWYRLGGNPYYSYWRDFNKSNPYYYSTSGRRGRLRVRYCPSKKGQWDVQDHTRRFSGYFQDSYTSGKLALNVGLRFDFSFQYEPEQTRPNLLTTYTKPAPLQNPAIPGNALLEAIAAQYREDQGTPSPFDELTMPYRRVVEFTTLSPRLGLVYDLFGDGKTALKASFARYYEPVWSAKYNAAQIFGAGSVNWYWYDLNKNKLMDMPGVDRYRLTSVSATQDPTLTYYVDNLKAPYMHEFMAGIEHELVSDFKLGLQFVAKVNQNLVEDIDKHNGYDPNATDEKGLIWSPFTFTDPGWDQELGTTDDQQLTVYGLRDDRPAAEWEGTNPPEAKRTYTALILTFDKRMSNRWQLKGSLLYSAFRGNASPEYGPTEGESSLFDNPNVMVNSYGRVAFDRPFQFKIMGSYILPYDIVVSGYFQARSGSAWGRTFSRVYFPKSMDVQQSYVGVLAETRGTRRRASYANLDLRVEKGFAIGDYGELRLYVDIFNVGGRSGINTNENPALWYRGDRTPVEWYADSGYGEITSIYGVRSVHFGLKLSF